MTRNKSIPRNEDIRMPRPNHPPKRVLGCQCFGNLFKWSPAMLLVPALAGSQRRLGVYRLGEETNPLLDLDDPHVRSSPTFAQRTS
jgi:hypothetical protein